MITTALGAVAELADALDLGSSSFESAGSIPVSPIRFLDRDKSPFVDADFALQPKLFAAQASPPTFFFVEVRIADPRGFVSHYKSLVLEMTPDLREKATVRVFAAGLQRRVRRLCYPSPD